MANGRNGRRSKAATGRDAGPFVAMPWSVLDSASYADLSHPARALLFELARQFVRDNNGRLLASRAYLATRGWKSADVIDRAKRQLIEAGFIFETVKGHRPNKASWFAVTWHRLDRHPGYDFGTVASFEQGAYCKNLPLKIASLSPSPGAGRQVIAPPRGLDAPQPVPSPGAIRANSSAPPVPSPGHHLDMPSAVAVQATH